MSLMKLSGGEKSGRSVDPMDVIELGMVDIPRHEAISQSPKKSLSILLAEDDAVRRIDADHGELGVKISKEMRRAGH